MINEDSIRRRTSSGTHQGFLDALRYVRQFDSIPDDTPALRTSINSPVYARLGLEGQGQEDIDEE